MKAHKISITAPCFNSIGLFFTSRARERHFRKKYGKNNNISKKVGEKLDVGAKQTVRFERKFAYMKNHL